MNVTDSIDRTGRLSAIVSYVTLEQMAWSRALSRATILVPFRCFAKRLRSRTPCPGGFRPSSPVRSWLWKWARRCSRKKNMSIHSTSLLRSTGMRRAAKSAAVLLDLAKLVAVVDPAKARSIVDDLYGGITSQVDIYFNTDSDPRVHGFSF